MSDDFGFMIIRYVNSEETDKYWKECYKSVRNHYPQHKIVIIDDLSDEKFVTQMEMQQTEIVISEYPRRGELLAYYYFHKRKPFKKALILHDSVFINQHIEFRFVDKVKFVWSFDHTWDVTKREMTLLNVLKNSTELKNLYNSKSDWVGCFGVMCVISWEFLNMLNTSCNLFESLIPEVTCREQRKALERVFACICTYYEPSLALHPSILGDIHKCIGWRVTLQDYLQGRVNNLAIIKVYTGR